MLLNNSLRKGNALGRLYIKMHISI